ncbi:MAG TPA: GNAT family N-acetyltransferase [Streptosporangiaceae bacterium]|jgi:diamine N-acetyltransferase
MPLRLVELTPDNVRSACGIEVKPEQQKFVAPVVESIAEAYVHFGTAWPRLILDDDRVVGFVMGNFDPESEIDAFRAGIWRLNIAADEQGQGYGRFAVEAIAAEARRRGLKRITVLWLQGDDGPEGFYQRLGFTPTGEVMGVEIVGELML